MTTEEKIEVMQAYIDGKKIQSRNFIGANPKDWEDWEVSFEPSWNWACMEYRIKPESKYVPYENTEEMIEDYCKRFVVERKCYEEPVIWIKNAGIKKTIVALMKDSVSITNGLNEIVDWNLYNLFKCCTYLDGSPVGKLVEE